VTLRIAAAVALLLGAAALLGFLRLLGEGPFVSLESRHLRDMKERPDPPTRVEPFSIADMVALPHRESVADYSAIERRGVVLEGYVQRMIHASDGDVHLEVVPHALAPGEADTAYVSAEITPRWRRDSANWSYERLLETFRPNFGGPSAWRGGTRRVRLTGWLLYDWQYDTPPRARPTERSQERLTGWEIHPVTGIEVWDDARARYVEYAR
jgi:hypothetical protein